MKKSNMNNKGFSLVELIVVIAIMAILVGVLAPSVLGQLDKANVAKDKQAVDAVATACAVAFADPMLKDKPGNGEDPVDVAGISWDFEGNSELAEGVDSPETYADMVKTMVGYTTVGFTSAAFQDGGSVTSTINTVTGKITIECTLDGYDEPYVCTK